MRTFVIRRLLSLIPLLVGVTFITQALLLASPGDYLTSLGESRRISAAALDVLRHQYHLESHNLFIRYGNWLWQAVHGNFGYSFAYTEPVWSLVWQRMFNTLILTGTALAISWGLAIPCGAIAAVKRDSWFDKLTGVVSFAGLSMPVVFFSLLLLLLAAKTGWFPVGGIHDEVNWDSFSAIQKAGDVLWHAALPSIVLGTLNMGGYLRQMRSEMTDTLSQDYIRTARAKGLSPRRIIFRHALGNAVNPMVSLFGFSVAYLLAGAILTETIFAWPGMGRLTFEALRDKDEPLVMATVVLLTLMLVVGSLISDVLLALIDPRIRLEGR
ncbi:MAG TPA: ABC transporter permease [Blastocatellia bacterium]|nr:ABC transporter permease [Blastocatellia bacterium]